MVDNSDVCTTLAECPHLAEKVKSFIFTYPTIICYGGPEVHLDNLTLALKNMTCLSTLKLIHSQKHYSSVLRYCDAKLHVFHCTYDAGDRQLLSFLNKQDNIRDLAMTGDPRSDQDTVFELSKIFPPTSLPHLTEISAPLFFLHAIVPGRPVQTVRFKVYHGQSARWSLDDVVGHSTVPVRNLGLDFTIWSLSVHNPRSLLPKHVEEITLTGFATGRPFTSGGVGPGWNWEDGIHLLLASTPSLRRLTFWMEGERDDAREWARLLFQEFHDQLSRLEHVSCMIAGSDMSTSFDFFEEKSGCLLTGPHEDNRTRGHRAAHDIREFMPVPVLCCWMGDRGLCDRKTGKSIQLDRREMERRMRMKAEHPELFWH
ncbi:hypothetical protein BDR03DRAFT_1091576 [Suillus americanus]|nr:hypothetical protein BDR03DRAFT_1091576 [Suillus americanus]